MVIAQLVRASDCGSEGRGFEPHWPPPIANKVYKVSTVAAGSADFIYLMFFITSDD